MTTQGMALDTRVMEIPTGRHRLLNDVNLTEEERLQIKRAKTMHKEHEKENLVTSGRIFIETFLSVLKTYNAPHRVCSMYLKKVLHAIFFLGHINDPQIPPEDFIPDRLQETCREKFPEIFEQRITHLARQTPYSILLEFLVENQNSEDSTTFMKKLADINTLLWKYDDAIGAYPVANDFGYAASIIACSRYNDTETHNTRVAYGSSMCCKGRIQRQIMIMISTLHVWDKAISYAVCSEGNGPAIRFPRQVQCEVYSFQTQNCNFKTILPCMTCDKLFKNVNSGALFLNSSDERPGRIGSYAETESLSKLLQCCPSVRNMMVTEQYQDQNQMNRDQIVNTFHTEHEDTLKNLLKKLLHERNFRVPDAEWLFFNPA